jgi:hypothetical protein
MELTFKPERLTIIRRLKGLSITDIDAKMREISGGKYKMNIDRWEKVAAKRTIENVTLLARATEVPLGFYYYNTVEITMANNLVEIYIPDTKELIAFKFI